MNLLTIRRYRPGDKDTVYTLHVTALKHAGIYLGGNWDSDMNQIEKIYIESGGEFFVGEHKGEIIAMGALRPHTSQWAELKRMRVLPQFQGQGFGQQMYDALEKRAKELGFTTLFLDVAEKQRIARKFYEKNGFVVTGRTVLGGQDTIIYEKKL